MRLQKKGEEDTRTPEELLDLIEEGTEIAEVLSARKIRPVIEKSNVLVPKKRRETERNIMGQWFPIRLFADSNLLIFGKYLTFF